MRPLQESDIHLCEAAEHYYHGRIANRGAVASPRPQSAPKGARNQVEEPIVCKLTFSG
jgi:hypothetical protein